MKRLLIAFNLVSLLTLSGCGGGAVGGTETGSTDTGAVTASAIGSVFSGSDQNASNNVAGLLKHKLLNLLIREAKAVQNRVTACEAVQSEGGEEDVVSSLSIEAGTYGAPGNEVTVTEADGCDQGGDYVSFVVESHDLVCSGGSLEGDLTVTMEDVSGIWTENLDDNVTEIYGTFNITSDLGSAENVLCSLTISHDGVEGEDGPISGDCVDGSGNAIEQTTETVCQDA